MDIAVLGLRVLLALVCVIGLIWVLARRAGWGKGRRRPAGPAVEVVGRQALGRHAGVAVVAIGDRRLLLGYGEQNVTMLTELDRVAEDPAAEPADDTAADTAAAGSAVPPGTAAAFGTVLAEAERAVAGGTGVRASTTVVAAATATAAASASAASALAASAAVPLALPAPTVAPASASDVPGLAGLEVAEVDAARLSAIERTTGEPAAESRSVGPLHGSVLAPSTWKQAVAVLRERTVRR